MSHGRFLFRWVTVSVLLFWNSYVFSSDFGEVGLLKIPTARLHQDATLRAKIAREDIVDIYSLSYQATPWLEATFRYSVFNPRDLPFSRDSQRDRSYGVKARLLEESLVRPEIAVGLRDILGTGIWEGEYLVASKAYGSFDTTIGLGWGRLGTRSPIRNALASLDESFRERPESVGGEFGGQTRGKSYFRGPMSIFGGVRYKLKNWPLELLLEYDSDDYSREVDFETIESTSPWNFGLEWRASQNWSIGFSWLHSSALGLSLRYQLNTKALPDRKAGAPLYSASEPRSISRAPENLDLSAWYDLLLYDLERSGLRLNQGRLENDGGRVSLEIENTGYALTADAIHRTLSMSEAHLPRSVKTVELSLQEEDLLAPTIQYHRKEHLKNLDAVKKMPGKQRFSAGEVIQVLPNTRLSGPTNVTKYRFPFIAFGGDLATRFQLMDPDAPFAKQLYLKFSTRISLARGLNLWGVYGQNIYNDFTTDRPSNSKIQKVRSDINKYLTEGESGLDQLFLEYRKTTKEFLHLRTYLGILESMYTGGGIEILLEPFGQRWAVGATMNYLFQRGYDKDFALKNYKTITRYMSLFYASPMYNVDFALHMGRYLAKDRGGTFEARRTFDNGFSIGGFFTKTDIPAELFGEGSFDKGLYFKIPFNGLLPGNHKASYATILRPLERDGGRRLEDFSGSLWFARRNVRLDALNNNLARMLP